MTTSFWTTDNLRSHDRFAAWREWRAALLYGVTADIERDARATFVASTATRSIGSATLVDISSSAYRSRRGWKDIARLPSDSLCIFNQIAGGAWSVDFPQTGEFVLPGCHMALGYTGVPYEIVPVTPDVFRTRLIKIPIGAVRDPDGRRARIRARLVDPSCGLDALLHAYARAFFQHVDAMSDADASRAIDVLAQLVLCPDNEDDASRDSAMPAAVATSRLTVAKSFIDAHLSAARLSPETVARALSISPRQLHRLFHATGTSFTKYVLDRRLERAASKLAKGGGGSVLDIALACGLSSSTVFYRAFRARFGMSPNDYRAFAQSRGASGDAKAD